MGMVHVLPDLQTGSRPRGRGRDRRGLESAAVILVALSALFMSGCYRSHGSDVDGPEPSRLEVDLSEAEYRELCEEFAGRMGWPDASLYECLDGGAVGRIDTPTVCLRRRHDPARIPECTLRVRDWLDCAEHYRANGMCDLAEVCRRPRECMAGGWQYLRP